jgi:hypothetical protein
MRALESTGLWLVIQGIHTVGLQRGNCSPSWSHSQGSFFFLEIPKEDKTKQKERGK